VPRAAPIHELQTSRGASRARPAPRQPPHPPGRAARGEQPRTPQYASEPPPGKTERENPSRKARTFSTARPLLLTPSTAARKRQSSALASPSDGGAATATPTAAAPTSVTKRAGLALGPPPAPSHRLPPHRRPSLQRRVNLKPGQIADWQVTALLGAAGPLRLNAPARGRPALRQSAGAYL